MVDIVLYLDTVDGFFRVVTWGRFRVCRGRRVFIGDRVENIVSEKYQNSEHM